jgi:transposase
MDDLSTRTVVLEKLGLSRLPEVSTIKKYAKRISEDLLDYLLSYCIAFTGKDSLKTAVDSTGFKLQDGSYHYRKRLGIATEYKKNVKSSTIIDTDLQLILSVKFRKNPAHDIKDFKSLVRNAQAIREIEIVTADKGYDSEENRDFVINEIEAECQIPLKQELGVHPGFYRKRFVLKEEKYHQRSKIETVFSVVKRVFGEIIYAKNWLMQKKEMLFRLITYNLYRLVKLRISP